MPKKNANTVRITITTTTQVRNYLRGLVKIGLHGNSVAEAAAQLVSEGLRANLKRISNKAIEEVAAPEVNKSATNPHPWRQTTSVT